MALHEICLPCDLDGTGHVCVRSLLQIRLAAVKTSIPCVCQVTLETAYHSEELDMT